MEDKKAKIQELLAANARKQIEVLKQIEICKRGHGAEFFRPYWYQQKFIDAMWAGKKTLLFQACNQSGKTLTGSCLIDSFCNGVQAWDKRASIFGGKPTKGRIVCSDWENHAKEVMVPKLKAMVKVGTYETTKNNMGVESSWRFKNGSMFNILTLTQDTMAHESDTLDWVWFDEPASKEKYSANVRGLVGSYGICLMTMTSLREAWILDDLVMSLDPVVQRDFFCITNINIRENKSLTEEGIQRFIAACPEDEREARINGGWLQLSGLVLKKFSREKHVRPAFKVPVDWPVVAFIDPHPNTPYAIGFYAVTPYGRRYVVDEFWGNVNGAGEAADEIIRRVKKNGWRLDTVYIDPYAKGDVRENGEYELDDTFHKIEHKLNAFDIVLRTAQRSERAKDVGIENLNGWLEGANLEPSLFIFDTCIRHIHEIQRWKYNDEGKPMKKDDHFPENMYRFSLENIEYTEPGAHMYSKPVPCGVV
jgi:phage terminase large subunit-like protein